MVVDDEPVLRETILEMLEDEGFEALGMTNAEHALSWAERIQPDILLSDIVMPGMNGIDMVIQLMGILPECRMILFTGNPAAPNLLEKAHAKGYTFEVLAKPIKPDLLIPTLRKLASSSEKRKTSA